MFNRLGNREKTREKHEITFPIFFIINDCITFGFFKLYILSDTHLYRILCLTQI